MKAWICEAFGEAPMLIDCEEPIAQAHQIIIDIATCGVNFADTLILEGKYQKRPTGPFAPGLKLPGPFLQLGRTFRVLPLVIGSWPCLTGVDMPVGFQLMPDW